MSDDDKRREAARCRRQQRIRDAVMTRVLLELETLPPGAPIADALDVIERFYETT